MSVAVADIVYVVPTGTEVFADGVVREEAGWKVGAVVSPPPLLFTLTVTTDDIEEVVAVDTLAVIV